MMHSTAAGVGRRPKHTAPVLTYGSRGRQTLRLLDAGREGRRLRREWLEETLRQLIVWVCLAAPAGAQIPGTAGPAILSRSGTLGYNGGERLGLIGIRPFLALNGTYDSGYGSVAVDPQGTADVRDFYGFSAAAGLSGFHNWRHTLLGVHYVLMGRHYPRFQKFDGIDQILSLGVSHQATRTLAIAVNGVGGSFVRGAGFALPNAYVDPYFSAVPTTEIFDARVYFASAGVDVTYTKTPRLSFNFGGTAAVVRRRGSLGALNSVGARTDVTYRVGKRSSIGVGYFFQHYDFQQQFGASDVHAEMLAYKTALGRRWSFDASAGIFRVESQFARRVQLDPAIAAILGQSTGVEAFHGVNYGFLGRASLTRSFRRSSVGLSYTQDVAPGNGIYLSPVLPITAIPASGS